VFLDPEFQQEAEISTADIGLLIFAWIFRISWPKMEVLRAKWGRGGAMLTPTN